MLESVVVHKRAWSCETLLLKRAKTKAHQTVLQIVKIGFENLIVSSYLNVKTVQCILLTWDSEIIPWTNDPEEKLQNHPSCTSIRSLSILIWRTKELSGSLSMGRTRWICWTRRSLNASFPIRLWRNVFMVHRYWNMNCDLAASLYTSPRYTAYCSFFITICISLHRTVTGQDRGLCGGSGSAVCDVLCRLLSNPKVSNTRPARLIPKRMLPSSFENSQERHEGERHFPSAPTLGILRGSHHEAPLAEPCQSKQKILLT